MSRQKLMLWLRELKMLLLHWKSRRAWKTGETGKPGKPEKPGNLEKPGNPEKANGNKVPVTGDETTPILWMTLVVMAGTIIRVGKKD